MTKYKNRFKTKLLAALAAAAMLASLAAMPTFAAVADTDETDATVTFTGGELELISAPSLVFETTAITGGEQVIDADSIDVPAEVSDLRGTGVGWSLTAQMGNFQQGGVNTLSGAYITVNNPTIQSDPTGSIGTPSGDDPIELVSGGAAVNIMTADDNEGRGVWQSIWDTADTTLTVLAGTAQAGTNVATINWSLEDTP